MKVVKGPRSTSNDLFNSIWLGNTSYLTSYRVLRLVAKVNKSKKRPPLTQKHREKNEYNGPNVS